MSVRRLAEQSVQPAAFAFNAAMASQAETWIAKYPQGRQASAVIPLLMLAQEQEGWVTKAAIENIAQMLAMPYIRVLEVATFYTQFQLHPVGARAHVQVCGTTPCMLRGAEDLIRVCREKIHAEPFHTNEGGTLSWEEVECQGACVNAPMVMIFKDTYEDLTPERLAEIIDAFEAGNGASVKPGPQIDRIYSGPEGGLTSLLSDPARTHAAPSEADGPVADEQEPTRAAKPVDYAPEGDPALASPAEAKGPGKRKSAAKPSADMGPTLTAPVEQKKDTPSHGGDVAIAGDAAAAARSMPGKLTRAKDSPAKAAKKAEEFKAFAAEAETRGFRLDDAARPKAADDGEDDLQLISGVGPKIESILHGLGVRTFAQIAGWSKMEIDWVDGFLKFKGRIGRDEWLKQAAALDKGEEEYIRVFGKKPR